MMDEFIVMCAPNGARRTRQDHPALPVTPDELATCARSIRDAGAAMMHVHVRSDDGRHTLDVARYRAAIAAIRGAIGDDLVIQVTSEACGVYSPERQMSMVRELRPEAVSVALREICPDRETQEQAAAFYAWMRNEGVMAQHILYSPEDVIRFESLRANGVIQDERPFVLFVLGRYASDLTGDVADLEGFVAAAAGDTTWAVCCFGVTEQAAVAASARSGGHARVGFENNLLLPDGAVAGDNAALVRLAVDAGRATGRNPATAAGFRKRFGLAGYPK
jgi:uncharacterized protein (DUF849 family)